MSSNSPRKLKYSLAINEAFHQCMESDPSVFVIGQGLKSPWYVGNTVKDLIVRFGEERVIDTPVSENAITGAAVGAAIAGMRPVVVHPRMDFMLYAIDPIINEAANWSYMCGGISTCPVVIWAIINRGGEQGAQHSQSLQAMFAHIPGLKVVMPSNANDAKGLMISAIYDNNPVMFIDDRYLYALEDIVPTEFYKVPIGKANVAIEGTQITIIASSYMVVEAKKAANELIAKNISVELIDLRSIKPLDTETIIQSARKTGRVLVVDGGWKSFGVSAEIVAQIQEHAFSYMKAPVKRLCLPDIPAPSSRTLEQAYYPNHLDIINAVEEMLTV